MIKSNKWKYTIKVKDLFEDDTTEEVIISCCERMISELQKVTKEVEKSNLIDDEKDDLGWELVELISNFEFLKDLASGEIEESEWDNYSFDGDFEQWFNDYLEQAYDLGDRRVVTKDNVQEKFMFIN